MNYRRAKAKDNLKPEVGGAGKDKEIKGGCLYGEKTVRP